MPHRIAPRRWVQTRLRLVVACCCAVLIAVAGLSFAPSAFAQFAPGCGPFNGGNPNIANFLSGNQLPVNTVIPIDTLTFGLATQPSGCAPYNAIRGVVGQSATLPPGVTPSNATLPNGNDVIRFNGTPTALGIFGPYGIEVSPDGGTTWALAMNVTFVVSSCLDWNGGRNQRFPLAYNAPNNYFSIPQPTAATAFSFEGSFNNGVYPTSAYCAATTWTLSNFGDGTMTGTSDPSPTLRKFLISGTPATTAQPQIDGCLTPDTGPDASITGFNSAGEDIVTANFCFSESNGGTITIGGNPPGGSVGVPYSTSLTTNAAPPLVWNFILLSGNLPPGLALASDGVISGTPTQSGTFSFVARVNAGDPGFPIVFSADGSFSITIDAAIAATPSVPVPALGGVALGLLTLLLAAFGATGQRVKRK
jgi:large repetitive protein